MALGPRCDVLIVEDNVMQCDEMADFLARAELRIETAYDGATARDKARLMRDRG